MFIPVTWYPFKLSFCRKWNIIFTTQCNVYYSVYQNVCSTYFLNFLVLIFVLLFQFKHFVYYLILWHQKYSPEEKFHSVSYTQFSDNYFSIDILILTVHMLIKQYQVTKTLLKSKSNPGKHESIKIEIMEKQTAKWCIRNIYTLLAFFFTSSFAFLNLRI